MLTQDELPDIAERLVEVASIQASPRMFLVSALPNELRAAVGEGEPRSLVDRVLRLCSDDGWRDTPPSMVRLLSALLVDDPFIAAIVTRLRTKPPTTRDAFDALVLYSKLPFLDRRPTRATLRDFLLERRPKQPVLVINGARRAGKSYIAEFVDHVLHDQPNVQHCRIPIEEQQGASVGPVELASDMVTGMGGDPTSAPEQNPDPDRWAKEIANWVISVANSSPINWWFVLDGFNVGELRAETQLLIVKLARSLLTGVARDRHRLILIDFNRASLPLQPGLIADHVTGPIPHAEVLAAVTEVIAGSGKDFDPATFAAKVVEGLADPIADLPELGQRLGDFIALVEQAVA